MKKLVFLFAVVFSVSMFSCKSADKNAAAEAADSVEVVEAAVIEEIAPADSVVADSAAVAVDSAAVAE